MKMKITKRQAIRRCKHFWKPALKGGLNKSGLLLLQSPEEQAEFLSYRHECPLCEYVSRFPKNHLRCHEHCPLYLQFGYGCISVVNYEEQPQEFAKLIMSLKE